MSPDNFDSFNLTISKPEKGLVTVGLRAKVRAGVDIVQAWEAARSQVLAMPCVAGFSLAKPEDEDVTVGLTARSIQSALRLTAKSV